MKYNQYNNQTSKEDSNHKTRCFEGTLLFSTVFEMKTFSNFQPKREMISKEETKGKISSDDKNNR